MKILPGIAAWSAELPWDRILVEDWSKLSSKECSKLSVAIKRGMHLLAVVAGEFSVPGLNVPMKWQSPPDKVLDVDDVEISVEALGSFDFVTSDDVRLAPGHVLHRGSNQELVTFEFHASSSGGRVIISSLQLFRPSLYSDERQRRTILQQLLERLSILSTPKRLETDNESTGRGVGTEDWKRQTIVEFLMMKRGLKEPDSNMQARKSPEAEAYMMRLEDARFLKEEAERLLPYAFRRRLKI